MSEAYAASIERLRDVAGTPRDPDGHAFAVIAEYLRRDGKLDEAKDVLEAGRPNTPNFASGHVVAAQVLVELGDLEGAREALDRVLELDPDNSLAPELKLELAAAEEAAALDWARAQGKGPPVEVDDQVVTVTLGSLYLEQGAPERAEEVALQLLAEDEGNESARALLDRARSEISPEATEPAPEDLGGLDPAPTVADVADLAPAATPIAELAPDPVPIAALAPDAVAIASLAPDAVPIQSLAPDENTDPTPSEGSDGEGERLDDFMSWLDDHS